jgi:glutaredoxin
MSSVPPARCARHDLAPGPDGRCVLCRRELQAATVIDIPAEPARVQGWVLGVLAAGLVIAATAFTLRRPAGPMQPIAAPEGPRPAAQRGEQKLERRDQDKPQAKTPEEQLAEAEREQAEREHQIAEAQRAEVRRRMEEAEAKRKLADEASDKQRHALVTRELDKAGLASARRNVDITMYSTSWCHACKQARAYMQEKNIAFTDYDVEHDAAARTQAHALNPRGSVPTISIDGDVMVGFSPISLESRIESAAQRRNGT